jgi:uncharacterized NAD(P)/FAD-binding protein YdhS
MGSVRYKFAIVGCGLTGTAMLCRLVERMGDKGSAHAIEPSALEVQLYEKEKIFGPGFPHSAEVTLPFHITNMCASDMGILHNRPEDFQEWVAGSSDVLSHRFEWFEPGDASKDSSERPCNHYPRAVMGAYLNARFQEAVKAARAIGISVKRHSTSEVVKITETKGRARLAIKNRLNGKLFTRKANRVLLATGHWTAAGCSANYFPSPWPAAGLLSRIPENEKVAVIGTSLSGIETLLTLTTDGEFLRSRNGSLMYAPSPNARTFVLYSRRGLLPKVRGRIGPRKNRYFVRENINRLLPVNSGGLKLNEIFELLNAELEDAYGRRINWGEVMAPKKAPPELLESYIKDAVHGDGPHGEVVWQTVLHHSFDFIRRIYLNLAPEDRRRFDREYTSVFFSYAAPQPIINAEKLLALMKSGIVEVGKLGNDYQLEKNKTGGYAFVCKDTDQSLKMKTFQYVVNARGQERSVATDPSELMKHLISTGAVHLGEMAPIPAAVNAENSGIPAAGVPEQSCKSGSVRIDPATHRVVRKTPEGRFVKSRILYAVGAMTREQIIDASMARSIVAAVFKVAEDLMRDIKTNLR